MADDTEKHSEIADVASADKAYGFERRERVNYDGCRALRPELETVAQFLATPRHFREIKTFDELAQQLAVSRMTVYRWTRHGDVLKRVEHLISQNELKGDLVARLNWERIVQGQIRAAMKGNTRAALFCERRAWPTPL